MAEKNPLVYIGNFVALDFETTGTDPEKDTIIEIGAIKFQEGEEVGRFHTLVNPFMKLPPFVQSLTGITDADLAAAPPIAAVIEDFWKFIEGFPIMAHNALFELKFLQKFFTKEFQPLLLDTVQLFLLVNLTGEKHSLSEFARFSKVPSFDFQSHRALEDAELMVHAVHNTLEWLLQEHEERIEAICSFYQMLKPLRWGWGQCFENIAKAKGVSKNELQFTPKTFQINEFPLQSREELDPTLFFLPALVDEYVRPFVEKHSLFQHIPIQYGDISKISRRLISFFDNAEHGAQQGIIAREPDWEFLFAGVLAGFTLAQAERLAFWYVLPSRKKSEDILTLFSELYSAIGEENLRFARYHPEFSFLCPFQLKTVVENYHRTLDDPLAFEFFCRLYLYLWGTSTDTGNIEEIPLRLRSNPVFQWLLNNVTQHHRDCKGNSACFYGRHSSDVTNSHIIFIDYCTFVQSLDSLHEYIQRNCRGILFLEADSFENALLSQQTESVSLSEFLYTLENLRSGYGGMDGREHENFVQKIDQLMFFAKDHLQKIQGERTDQPITYIPFKDESWRLFGCEISKQIEDCFAMVGVNDGGNQSSWIFSTLNRHREFWNTYCRNENNNVVYYAVLYNSGDCVCIRAPLTIRVPETFKRISYSIPTIFHSSFFLHQNERNRLLQILGIGNVETINTPEKRKRSHEFIFLKGLPRANSEHFSEKSALVLHRLIPILSGNIWIVAHQRKVLDAIYAMIAELIPERLVYFGKTHQSLDEIRSLIQKSNRTVVLSPPIPFDRLGYFWGLFQWVFYDRFPYIIPTPRTAALREQWLLEQEGDIVTGQDWEAIEQPMMFRNFRKVADFLSYGTMPTSSLLLLDPNLSATTLSHYHHQLLEYVPELNPILLHYEQLIEQVTKDHGK